MMNGQFQNSGIAAKIEAAIRTEINHFGGRLHEFLYYIDNSLIYEVKVEVSKEKAAEEAARILEVLAHEKAHELRQLKHAGFFVGIPMPKSKKPGAELDALDQDGAKEAAAQIRDMKHHFLFSEKYVKEEQGLAHIHWMASIACLEQASLEMLKAFELLKEKEESR